MQETGVEKLANSQNSTETKTSQAFCVNNNNRQGFFSPLPLKSSLRARVSAHIETQQSINQTT